jgi:phosphoribosyl-AMP cyclohydrolase
MEIPSGLIFYQGFGKDLIPVVIQDFTSREVLMLGTMSRESLVLTLENNVVYLYALSRQEIWLKGEQSGVFLKVRDIRVNCNQSNLLILVDYAGNICHTGHDTCFYRRLVKQNDSSILEEIEQ